MCEWINTQHQLGARLSLFLTHTRSLSPILTQMGSSDVGRERAVCALSYRSHANWNIANKIEIVTHLNSRLSALTPPPLSPHHTTSFDTPSSPPHPPPTQTNFIAKKSKATIFFLLSLFYSHLIKLQFITKAI